MSEKSVFDRIATTVVAIAAVVVAVSVARREFFSDGSLEPAKDRAVPSPVRLSTENWERVLASGIMLGDSGASVKVAAFMDFECPACKIYHERVLPEIMRKYGKRVALVMLHFPLSGHRFARTASAASECAAEQGRFPSFSDLLFAKQDSIGLKGWTSYARESGVPDTLAFQRCTVARPGAARIDSGLVLARDLELNATSTVIVNGWRFFASPPVVQLSRLIDSLSIGRDPFR